MLKIKYKLLLDTNEGKIKIKWTSISKRANSEYIKLYLANSEIVNFKEKPEIEFNYKGEEITIEYLPRDANSLSTNDFEVKKQNFLIFWNDVKFSLTEISREEAKPEETKIPDKKDKGVQVWQIAIALIIIALIVFILLKTRYKKLVLRKAV
jgi:hypothetical protein